MSEGKTPVDTKDYDEDFFEWEERDESISYVNHCIAGSIAGVAEHILLLPFDNIKTHMQVHEGKYGAVSTAKYLYKTEGFAKFWRGASVLASGCVPAHAAYFSVYEFWKEKLLPKLHDQKNEVHPHVYALTGILATLMHDFIITPFDTIKQRKQIAPQHLNDTKLLLKYILTTEGPRSLYKGFPITVLMNIPHAAALVCVNESLKVLYRPQDGHNLFTYLICAAVGGSVGAVATIPFDNIKTRLQTQTFYHDSRRDVEKVKNLGANLSNMATKPFASSANGAQHIVEEVITAAERKIKYQDILSTLKTILKEEGMKGFVKGCIPRVLTHAPSSAVSWTAYEMLKEVLNKRNAH